MYTQSQVSPAVQALVDQIRSGRQPQGATFAPNDRMAAQAGSFAPNNRMAPVAPQPGRMPMPGTMPVNGQPQGGVGGLAAMMGAPAQGGIPPGAQQNMMAAMQGMQPQGGIAPNARAMPAQPAQPQRGQLPPSLMARLAAFNGAGGQAV